MLKRIAIFFIVAAGLAGELRAQDTLTVPGVRIIVEVDTTRVPVIIFDTTRVPVTVFDTTRVPVTVFDTTIVPVFVDDSICRCDPIPDPEPDPIPEPEPEPEPDPIPDPTLPPTTPDSVRMRMEGDTLVTAWFGGDADAWEIRAGNDDTGRAYLPALLTASPHRRTDVDPGRNWTCIFGVREGHPDSSPGCNNVIFTPSSSTYRLSITVDPTTISDVREVIVGVYSIHLNRRDGAWSELGNVVVPGVDSIVFVLDGFRNRERRLPYEATGGPVDVPAGRHIVEWEVFGLETDAGVDTFTAVMPDQTSALFDLRATVPMEDGLMVQVLKSSTPFDLFAGTPRPTSDFVARLDGVEGSLLPGALGWYWLPAPADGSVIVRDASTGAELYRASYP